MMLTIQKTGNEADVTLELTGKLDTTTAPELKKALEELEKEVQTLTIDFAGLEYISSAGLRVLLTAHKAMMKLGGMKIIHANEAVMEVMDETRFSDVLIIE